MNWLWEGHLLRGSLELWTGIPGMGKSQVHCQIVASVTTGRPWPDGTKGAQVGSVIMLTAEDCLDQIIVPRLLAAKADLDRVHILKKIRKDDKDRMFLLTDDIEILAKAIADVGDVGLVTIDPITAYMGGKVDSHRATDVRSQLGPLAELAERTDVAFSAITTQPKTQASAPSTTSSGRKPSLPQPASVTCVSTKWRRTNTAIANQQGAHCLATQKTTRTKKCQRLHIASHKR